MSVEAGRKGSTSIDIEVLVRGFRVDARPPTCCKSIRAHVSSLAASQTGTLIASTDNHISLSLKCMKVLIC